MSKKQNMLERKSWSEFRGAGLLWFTNRLLHLFGWAICFVIDDADGRITEVYPAKTKFRGFAESAESEGFKQLTKHIKKNIGELVKAANE